MNEESGDSSSSGNDIVGIPYPVSDIQYRDIPLDNASLDTVAITPMNSNAMTPLNSAISNDDHEYYEIDGNNETNVDNNSYEESESEEEEETSEEYESDEEFESHDETENSESADGENIKREVCHTSADKKHDTAELLFSDTFVDNRNLDASYDETEDSDSADGENRNREVCHTSADKKHDTAELLFSDTFVDNRNLDNRPHENLPNIDDNFHNGQIPNECKNNDDVDKECSFNDSRSVECENTVFRNKHNGAISNFGGD
jgi:hypothetical protein